MLYWLAMQGTPAEGRQGKRGFNISTAANGLHSDAAVRTESVLSTASKRSYAYRMEAGEGSTRKHLQTFSVSVTVARLVDAIKHAQSWGLDVTFKHPVTGVEIAVASNRVMVWQTCCCKLTDVRR